MEFVGFDKVSALLEKIAKKANKKIGVQCSCKKIAEWRQSAPFYSSILDTFKLSSRSRVFESIHFRCLRKRID